MPRIVGRSVRHRALWQRRLARARRHADREKRRAATYRAVADAFPLDLVEEVSIGTAAWRHAVGQEHHTELAYIRADIETPMVLQGLTLAEAVTRAQCSANLVEYADGLLAYALVGLAHEHNYDQEQLTALFVAAGLEGAPVAVQPDTTTSRKQSPPRHR